MNTKLLDLYVVQILKENGWYESRNYNIAYWMNQLTQEGYVSFNYAIEILENLGGLSFNIKDDSNYKGAQFDFNPYFAGNGEFDRLKDYELAANETLFPIGSMCSAIVYVGINKNIYWGDLNRLYWDGNCIEDYLNRLFDKKSIPQKIS